MLYNVNLFWDNYQFDRNILKQSGIQYTLSLLSGADNERCVIILRQELSRIFILRRIPTARLLFSLNESPLVVDYQEKSKILNEEQLLNSM